MEAVELGSAYILVVDDTPSSLDLLVSALGHRGHRVLPLLQGRLALDRARSETPALVILDVHMSEMSGFEVCAELKSDPRLVHVPVIFLSASPSLDDKVRGFALGGVDYLTKPFQFEELFARVETHLKLQRLRDVLDRRNHKLEAKVQVQLGEIFSSNIATITALAKLSECRDEDTGNHIVRVQQYSRLLAHQLAESRAFPGLVDDAFIENLFHASALHDIGKVGISDTILLKPGHHSAEEFETMKTHSALGAEALAAIMDAHPHNAFLRMGVQVARSHHERWDGSGYPDGLAGDAIPLSARIVFLADQYDALRNKRPYKPPFDARRTHTILTEGDGRSDPRHIDPHVLRAYEAVAPEFDAICERFQEPPTPRVAAVVKARLSSLPAPAG